MDRNLSTTTHPRRERWERWRHGLGVLAGAACVALLGNAASAFEILLQPGFDQMLLGNAAGSRAWGVAAADFDGDGIDDLVSGNTAGDVQFFHGRGDGTLEARGTVVNMTFNDAYALAAGDFDGDMNADFVLSRTTDSVVPADGDVLLYLGNGDGTFQSMGFPQLGLLVGDAGTDVVSLAAGDVDGDGDIDVVAGDIATSAADPATLTLFRNQLVQGSPLVFTSEVVDEGFNRSPPDPEDPPYFPPISTLQGYGLALGDMDGDSDLDLLVGDRASYLYVYENGGTGDFSPIRYARIGTRPFAYDRLHAVFTYQMTLAAGDLNGDGRVDVATVVNSADGGVIPSEIDLWLNAGPDGAGRPTFVGAGVVSSPGAGTDARGLVTLQLDPSHDAFLDLAFGNKQGDLYGLFADLTDTDGDGIVDRFDNAPMDFNPPLLDMNTDGAFDRLDQLDADADGVGDPADTDDDDDGVLDASDDCPLVANGDQADADSDGRGDACDPLNDHDTDGDGVLDGPIDPSLYARAREARARWARSDTHFIVRIDALGRVFQNEFTQTLADGASLDPASWDAKKFENYNGVGDDPALPGYNVPDDLPGGEDVPISLVVIPKQLWDAFGDDDPIRWINDRNANPNLEIGQHGTYHVNNIPTGSWADDPMRNFFSCETCGHPLEAVFQLLRVGKRTLLGDYEIDPWIQESGAETSSPRIDWSDAANPLIGYAPPFNGSDAESRDATARLLFPGFSASLFEEQSPIFSPEGSHQEQFDAFGMFHASADLEVDPVAPAGMTYAEYLDSITQPGGLNTWLIEEVEWSTRYCNDLPRLVPCAAAPDGVNRENNMVDEARWNLWLTLLEHVKANGEAMTLGDYALAVATDNCPAIANPTQADADADGKGDACDVDRIDVMPNSAVNPISPKKKGEVPVVIFGTAALDVHDVDVRSLRFGPDGAPPSHDLTDPLVYADHLQDIDLDGFVDLVSHYSVPDTGIDRNTEEACLSGIVGATPFQVCEGIRTSNR